MRVRFWIRQGLQTLGLILGASLLYSFLMFIQTDFGLDGLLTLLPIYLLLFGSMMMVATTIGIYKMAVPLVISFGSTRNEVLLGLQISRLIPIVSIPAAAALLSFLFPQPETIAPAAMLLLGIGLFLGTSALGSILGVVYTKYGRFATLFTVVFILLCAFAGGFLAAFSEDFGTFFVLFRRGLPGIVLGIGLFLYGISIVPEHRTVWKCNVKL